jgi:hypothetical protein
MTIRTKVTYITSDGFELEDKRQAEQHEAGIEFCAKYRKMDDKLESVQAFRLVVWIVENREMVDRLLSNYR